MCGSFILCFINDADSIFTGQARVSMRSSEDFLTTPFCLFPCHYCIFKNLWQGNIPCDGLVTYSCSNRNIYISTLGSSRISNIWSCDPETAMKPYLTKILWVGDERQWHIVRQHKLLLLAYEWKAIVPFKVALTQFSKHAAFRAGLIWYSVLWKKIRLCDVVKEMSINAFSLNPQKFFLH